MSSLIYCLDSYPLVTTLFLVLVFVSIARSLSARCGPSSSCGFCVRDFLVVGPLRLVLYGAYRVLVEHEPNFEMRSNMLPMRNNPFRLLFHHDHAQ